MRDWTFFRSAIVQNNYGMHLHLDLRLVAAEQRRAPSSLVVSKTAVFPAPLQVWPQLVIATPVVLPVATRTPPAE